MRQPSRYVTAPEDWDRLWRFQLRRINEEPAWIAFIGDSYMQGQDSSDWAATPFRMLLREGVLKQYPLYGDYYPCTDSMEYIKSYNGVAPWVIDPSAAWAGWFCTPCCYWGAAEAGLVATFTSPGPCAAMDVLYCSNNSGGFSYRVDDGPPILVEPTTTETLTRLSITGIDPTMPHRLIFGSTSSANVLILMGVCTYTNAVVRRGVGFANLAYSGAYLGEWLSTNSVPSYPKSAVLAGKERSGAAAGNFGFPTQPHLAIIGLGINDMIRQEDPQTFFYGLCDLCEALRAGRQQCSLLIVANSCPDGLHSDVNPIMGFSANYRYFLAAQEEAAKIYGAAFLNVHAWWAGHGAADGYQTPASQHPTDAGHRAMAAALDPLVR